MNDMLHTKPVVKGAPNTLIIADMPFGSYNVSTSEAILNANRIMKEESGADGVKLEGGRSSCRNRARFGASRHSGHGACWSYSSDSIN